MLLDPSAQGRVPATFFVNPGSTTDIDLKKEGSGLVITSAYTPCRLSFMSPPKESKLGHVSILHRNLQLG